ncbi:MAG: hypothetical protein ACYS22_00880 [Planctomycetota bacterium]|jgi:hypothetical protein
MAETMTLSLVAYLDPELIDALPPGPNLVYEWPTEECCAKVPDLMEHAEDEADADMIRIDAQEFEGEMLSVIRRTLLPRGALTLHMHVDPMGSMQFAGLHEGVKVRVDQQFNICLMRRSPLPVDPEQPRLLQLRRELDSVLSIPLASPDRKPVKPAVLVDLSAYEPGAVYAELKAPPGAGFAFGRFERLKVYSDGKVLLIGFTPTRAGVALPVLPRGTYSIQEREEMPDRSEPGTGNPPVPSSHLWSPDDQARVDENRAILAEDEVARAAEAEAERARAAAAAEAAGADAASGAGDAKGGAGKDGAGGSGDAEGAAEDNLTPEEEAAKAAAAKAKAAQEAAEDEELTARERLRKRREAREAKKEQKAAEEAAASAKAAAAAEREAGGDSGEDGAESQDQGPAPSLRLDPIGEFQDDKVDVDAWEG